MKRLVCLWMVLLFAACVLPAMAGTSVTEGRLTAGYNTSLEHVPTFKFFHIPKGLGIGNCPVYTAPSTKAFRCADGKASVDTRGDIFILGKDTNGWLMVRYETNKGSTRVGYIPPKYAKNYHTKYKLKFAYVPMEAEDTLYVTDNPMDDYSYYAILDPGETYYVLGNYTYYGDWWYIECEVDGKQARGFIAK